MRGHGEAATSLGRHRGSPSPCTGHLQHPQIPREHLFTIHGFPEHRGKGELKLGQHRTCSSLEKSPLCLLWGGEGCQGG